MMDVEQAEMMVKYLSQIEERLLRIACALETLARESQSDGMLLFDDVPGDDEIETDE